MTSAPRERIVGAAASPPDERAQAVGRALAPAGETRPTRPRTEGLRWWTLIHQIPPQPNYLRVKIGRHLARVGAVALKNTVYLLPCTDSAFEDLAWIAREI